MKRYNNKKSRARSETAGRTKRGVEVRSPSLKLDPNPRETPVSGVCSDEKPVLPPASDLAEPSSKALGKEEEITTPAASGPEVGGSSRVDDVEQKSSKPNRHRERSRNGKDQAAKGAGPGPQRKMRLPARANVANKYIAMSLFEQKSKEQGILDAQKEMAVLDGDADRDAFFEVLLTIKDLHVQGLGYILASWFWKAKIMTRSYAIAGILAQLRSYGLQYELSDNPEVCIGDPLDYNPLFVILGTGVGSLINVPYYDQYLNENLLARYGYLIFRDHHHELLCLENKLENWPKHKPAQRFSTREVDSGRLHGILFRKEKTSVRIHSDLLVRSLLRASRSYSEAVFSVALQYIGDHANQPTYWIWDSGVAVEAVMSVLEENRELLNMRLEYSNRGGYWDEKYLDGFSGFTLGGRSFGTETMLSFYDEVILPKARQIKKKMKESVHDIERHFKDRFDPPDDDPPSKDDDKASSSDYVAAKEEEVAKTVEKTIISIQGEYQELAPYVPETGPVEVDTLVSLMCFHGALETSIELSRKNLSAAALKFLEHMPYIPLHPFVYSYNSICDRYFYVPRVNAFLRYMELYDRLRPYDAQENTMSLFVTTNQFPSARDPINLPVTYFDHHIESPKCAIGICFTQAELGFHDDQRSVIPWRDHFQGVYENMSLDRIECSGLASEWAAPLFNHGFISEVYYAVYFRPALCFTRACLPSVFITRLARPVPPVEGKSATWLRMFRVKCKWPQVEYENESPIVTEEVFCSYMTNMPAESRKKHLEHFRQRFSVAGVEKMPGSDSAFPKYDEVLWSCKPRLIINPPSELFYQLVLICTMLKRALKREFFTKVYCHDRTTIYFSYGADMTVAQKGDWFGRALDLVKCSIGGIVACIVVGGDDNACLIGVNGHVFAWESDVTACDQSHNVILIDSFVNTTRDMGVPISSTTLLRESYDRPIRVGDIKITFKKPQLHTGHPQTSLANTFTVGQLCMTMMAGFDYHNLVDQLRDPDFHRDLAETLTEKAKLFGMIFKVQVHSNPWDLTFHKGHWLPTNDVRCKYGAVWLPLPSSLWKATKIRTDSHISRKELLIRMAFNLYQRLIYPNHRIVRQYCLKLFRNIMKILDEHSPVDEANFGTYVELHFKRYYERAKLNKAGEIDDQDPFMKLDEEPFWDEGASNAFLHSRYRLCESDLAPPTGQFGGVRCVGWETIFARDYGSDKLSEAYHQIFGYSSYAVSSSSS
jgi:hypothetical protein